MNSTITSDYAPFTVSIPIMEENINLSKFSIIKNNKEKALFIKDVSSIIKNLDIFNLSNTNKLEDIVNTLASKTEYAWNRNAKLVNITKHSKSWWTDEYSQSLKNYRTSRSIEDWKTFKNTVKNTK